MTGMTGTFVRKDNNKEMISCCIDEVSFSSVVSPPGSSHFHPPYVLYVVCFSAPLRHSALLHPFSAIFDHKMCLNTHSNLLFDSSLRIKTMVVLTSNPTVWVLLSLCAKFEYTPLLGQCPKLLI